MIDLKQCSLGIELGSTRIKAVLVGDTCKPVAQGDFTWENRLENGIWTYPLEEVWQGVQAAYAALAADVLAKCGQPLTTVGCIGVSAMMHGRATPAPAWWRQTVSPRAPAMSAQAPAFLPWSSWKSRCPRSTRKSTWSRPPTARRSPWSTATTAPAI